MTRRIQALVAPYRAATALALSAGILYILFGAIGVAAILDQDFADHVIAYEGVLVAYAAVTVALMFAAWLLAIYLLASDPRISRRCRRWWSVILVIFNLFAGMIFILVRAYQLRRTR